MYPKKNKALFRRFYFPAVLVISIKSSAYLALATEGRCELNLILTHNNFPDPWMSF